MSSMNQRTSNEPTPRGFIVRIYRWDAGGLVGQAQDALTGRVRTFSSLAELWVALGGRPQPARAACPRCTPTHDKEHS
jgi:hypothetical protein